MSMAALTQFRMFLDRMDPGDPEDLLMYFRLLALAGEEAFGELGMRLKKAGTARNLRLLYVESAFYYPAGIWAGPLSSLLRREQDLEVFTLGTWALGRTGGQAVALLGSLYDSCTRPEFKAVLSAEILRTDPRKAFDYHLHRLLEGTANPRVANEAALELTHLVIPERLADLVPLVRNKDMLIARHALKLLSLLRTPEAGTLFLGYLREFHAEILSDRALKEALASLRNVTVPALPEALAIRLKGAFSPEDVEELLSEDAHTRTKSLGRLRSAPCSTLQGFLLETFALLLEGRGNQWAAFLAGASEALHQRGRGVSFNVDTCARALGAMAAAGHVSRAEALESVRAAYLDQTGREGVARVFGSLVDAGDQESLELLMAGQDSGQRGAALDALGSRFEEALLPVLLRACRDPIVETAQRAMLSLGRTPGGQAVVQRLLEDPSSEEVRLGLALAGLNRFTGTIPQIFRIQAASEREDLVLACVKALGRIGAPEAAPGLLDLLHSGQSLRLQGAVASALRALGNPGPFLGLAERALSLHNPQVQLEAAEAILATRLEARGVALLRSLVQVLWEDKSPWPLRHRLILAFGSLDCDDPVLHQELASLATAALADKRCQSVWSTAQQNSARAALRMLNQKILQPVGS